jgi:tetratricopeptide (TPR) repeat protein
MDKKAPTNSIEDKFIGREREIAIFEQWLEKIHTTRSILYFHDAASEPEKKGGIGKTRLLERCIEIAKAKNEKLIIVRVDFFQIIDRDGRTIVERVYDELKAAYSDWWSADAFDRARKEYPQTDDKNNTNSTEIRDKLSEALTSDLRNLDPYLHPMQCTLLLVLDTFEVIQDNPSVAVFSPLQKFPDDYHFEHVRFLMAGRDAINWEQPNWQGLEGKVQSVPLLPFNQDEMIHYMNAYEIQLEPASPQAVILQELTGGRPILLGLVKDVLGHSALRLEDLLSVPPTEFEAHLVSQIANFNNPINWFILFMAHAYHRFNANMLDWLLKEHHWGEAIEKAIESIKLENLPDLSFVRRATDKSGDFTLHDEMRPLITKHYWQNIDPDKTYRKEISHYVILYYEKALDNEQNDLVRQTYIAQILYHKAFLDINEGIQYFTWHFDRAISLWQNAFARALLKEIQKFPESLSAHQRADLVMQEARLLLKEENRETALDYYRQLLEEAKEDWAEAHKAEILYGRAHCLLAMAQFQEASDSFNAALELERERKDQKKIADILNSLGYISRRLGQLDQAVKYYQESFFIYKELGKQPGYLRELANNLNSLGYVHCLLGKIDEALIYSQQGLHIRERLSNNNEVSEIAIGLSYSTLGYIYLYDSDDVNAKSCFERAFEIFTRKSYKKGLAMFHNRFGQIMLKMKILDIALNHFETAFEDAVRIDEEAQITSLNRQGHVYILRQEYKDARRVLEHAVELAMRVHDSYQEVEARIDLARVLAHLQEQERYNQELERATAIAEQQHYNKQLGEIEKLRGELPYQQQEHEDAFLHYAKFCYFMAQHNAIECRKAFRFLTDQLIELLQMDNAAEVAKVIEVLRTYWKEQQLESKFPEFLRVCDGVSDVNL